MDWGFGFTYEAKGRDFVCQLCEQYRSQHEAHHKDGSQYTQLEFAEIKVSLQSTLPLASIRPHSSSICLRKDIHAKQCIQRVEPRFAGLAVLNDAAFKLYFLEKGLEEEEEAASDGCGCLL